MGCILERYFSVPVFDFNVYQAEIDSMMSIFLDGNKNEVKCYISSVIFYATMLVPVNCYRYSSLNLVHVNVVVNDVLIHCNCMWIFLVP